MLEETMWWICSILLAYNFWKAWKSDPGFLKTDREMKIKVSLILVLLNQCNCQFLTPSKSAHLGRIGPVEETNRLISSLREERDGWFLPLQSVSSTPSPSLKFLQHRLSGLYMWYGGKSNKIAFWSSKRCYKKYNIVYSFLSHPFYPTHPTHLASWIFFLSVWHSLLPIYRYLQVCWSS